MKKMNKRIENHGAFWGLLAKGSTLIAACEAVGVGGSTNCRRHRNSRPTTRPGEKSA